MRVDTVRRVMESIGHAVEAIEGGVLEDKIIRAIVDDHEELGVKLSGGNLSLGTAVPLNNPTGIVLFFFVRKSDVLRCITDGKKRRLIFEVDTKI